MAMSELEQLTGLNWLRERYEKTGKISPSELRGVYNNKIDTPRGCLSILYRIYRNGDYSPSDSVFVVIDERYCSMLEKARLSKNIGALEFQRLERTYEKLLKRLDKINRRVYVDNRAYCSVEGIYGDEDEDSLGPSQEELIELEQHQD